MLYSNCSNYSNYSHVGKDFNILMKKINLPNIKNVYFIGIGGISMSGLAHILHDSGYNVSGSDRQKNQQTQDLVQIGININNSQISDNITKDLDLIIYTAAIRSDNPEYIKAKELGITMYSRAKLLGHIISHYQKSICIAGTHGKTTTTSMMSHLLISLGLKPTISVGAYFDAIGGNFLLGESDYFVVESCEYNDSFLEFKPHIGVILNLEFDHPDHFENLEQMEQSFKEFADNVTGYLIINNKIANYQKIISDTKAKIITFGEDSADFCYQFINDHAFNFNNKEYHISVLGKHNMENATAALAVANTLDIDTDPDIFTTYNNPKRRLEYKGTTKNDTLIFDDYGHHPTEILATLSAIKNRYPDKKIHCLFQPHTFSRTMGLLDDFAVAFADSHITYLLDIFGARETSGNIHTKDLQKLIKNTETQYFETFEKAEKFLEKSLSKDDLLITMGATEVYIIGENLIKK